MALINGVPSNRVSIDDRGLLYGQSLFETICVADGRCCLLDAHLDRLAHGASVLGIPLDADAAQGEATQLAKGQKKAVIRLSLTMGSGGRGYANPTAPDSTRLVSLHEFPSHPAHYWQRGIELGLANIRLSAQPALAGLKHGNRLEQIIARSEWQPGWQEALLLDQNDKLIEATQSNVFLLKNNRLSTPMLNQCGVQGVLRDFILEHANELGFEPQCVSLSLADVEAADAIFVCNSVIGLWPVHTFGERNFSDLKYAEQLLTLLRDYGAIPNC